MNQVSIACRAQEFSITSEAAAKRDAQASLAGMVMRAKSNFDTIMQSGLANAETADVKITRKTVPFSNPRKDIENERSWAITGIDNPCPKCRQLQFWQLEDVQNTAASSAEGHMPILFSSEAEVTSWANALLKDNLQEEKAKWEGRSEYRQKLLTREEQLNSEITELVSKKQESATDLHLQKLTMEKMEMEQIIKNTFPFLSKRRQAQTRLAEIEAEMHDLSQNSEVLQTKLATQIAAKRKELEEVQIALQGSYGYVTTMTYKTCTAYYVR